MGRYDGETYTCAMGKTHQAHTVKGKAGGTLRRGWTAKSQGEAESGSGNGMSKVASYAAALPVKKAGNAYTVEVINPVEYASYVEYGHRTTKGGWVPGHYVLTLSEQDLESLAPAAIERKLELQLRQVFNV